MFEVKLYGSSCIFNIFCSGNASNSVAHAIFHVGLKIGDKTIKHKNHNEHSFTWSGEWLLLDCITIDNHVLYYKDYFWSN